MIIEVLFNRYGGGGGRDLIFLAKSKAEKGCFLAVRDRVKLDHFLFLCSNQSLLILWFV